MAGSIKYKRLQHNCWRVDLANSGGVNKTHEEMFHRPLCQKDKSGGILRTRIYRTCCSVLEDVCTEIEDCDHEINFSMKKQLLKCANFTLLCWPTKLNLANAFGLSSNCQLQLIRCCFLPRSQNEASCVTIRWEICSAYRFIFTQIKLIFTQKLLHEDSFWNWGKW